MDIVIGAGASGLTYAALTNNPCLVLEAEGEVGGYCRTIRKEGFVWDYSGHFFHFRDPSIRDMILSHMPEGEILTCRKQSQIYYRGHYIDFPFQKNIHQLRKPEFIDCLYDLFCNPYTEMGSFKQMLYAKFGKSIADKFLIPYNEKLYACDLEDLDCQAMGRFFPYADREEIIANFKKSQNESYNDTFIYPRGGAIEYIKSLQKRLPEGAIALNERVIAIDTSNRTVLTNKRRLPYDHLVSTIPFTHLLRMCAVPYNDTYYSWNKVLVFNLGFDRPSDDVRNNWVYFPDEQFCFYRVGYYNQIFNDERMSLYVEVGYPPDAWAEADAMLPRVLSDLRRAGIVRKHQLVAWHSVMMNPAYVHINENVIQDVEQKKELLSRSDIYSIGRYGSWTYCSIEDGMLEARSLAERLSTINTHPQ